jgi:16S rRNA (uracil1498-N3)-methyltransferase
MHLFFDPAISGNRHILEQQEATHCVRVLRLKENDIVHLTDGRGNLYKSKIIMAHPKKCELEIIETQSNYNRRNYHLHIVIAPTKNIDRFEWFLEKATEIGIDEITPLICEHSERRVIKPERLIKVISSAMKQSLKTYLPKLNEITSFKKFIETKNTDNKFITNCKEDPHIQIHNQYKAGDALTILIGPEGDFSDEELENALSKGYISISLGNSRLRTETAGLVACHAVYLANQLKS